MGFVNGLERGSRSLTGSGCATPLEDRTRRLLACVARRREAEAIRPRLWWVGGAVAVAVAALMLSSCSTLERTVIAPPMIEGASFVGNKSCYECHTNITRLFPSSP